MTTPQDCTKPIQVTRQNANNYCRILSLLGMEEEGNPVAEVERLIAAAGIPATQVGGVEPVAKPAIVLTLAQSNDFDPNSITIRIWKNVGGLGVGEHALYAAPQSPATPEPMHRFCPGCGSVSEVAGSYLKCCPDGSEARVIPAAPVEPKVKWPADKYDERQRAWCLRYERETTFEPLMDGYETGETTFAEAAKLSLFWFESWSSDAYNRSSNGNIPGGEMDLFDAAHSTQAAQS